MAKLAIEYWKKVITTDPGVPMVSFFHNSRRMPYTKFFSQKDYDEPKDEYKSEAFNGKSSNPD